MKKNLSAYLFDKFKPAVKNTFLIFIAGIVWAGVGMILLSLACSWLSAESVTDRYLYAGAGVLPALLVHRHQPGPDIVQCQIYQGVLRTGSITVADQK